MYLFLLTTVYAAQHVICPDLTHLTVFRPPTLTLCAQQPHTAEDLLDIDDLVYKPFTYHNLGSLAYIGNAAAFDLDGGWSFAGGLVAMCKCSLYKSD